jgi:hypothetical protein
MRVKTGLIQHEYSADLDSKSDYLLVVEVVEDVPVASYTVRVPTPNTSFPLLSQIKN